MNLTEEKSVWIKPVSIELPIEKNPPIKSFLHHAFPLSIMYTNEKYKTYHYSNFIQLIYDPTSGCAYDFHEYHYKSLPYFYSDRLDDSMTKHINTDINEFISMQIVNRYYCIAWVDTYYIPGEMFYNKQHITHGILIYKYDDEKREYTALAYRNQNVSYGMITIPYDDFSKAYESEYFSMLDFLKLNMGMIPRFNETSIRKKLSAYKNSIDYDFDDMKFHSKDRITLYGKEACIYLFNYLNHCKKNNERIDLRYIYVFKEHKTSIIQTLRLLSGYKVEETSSIENNIEQSCEKMLLQAIKYNKTKDELDINVIIQIAKKVLKFEQEVLDEYSI